MLMAEHYDVNKFPQIVMETLVLDQQKMDHNNNMNIPVISMIVHGEYHDNITEGGGWPSTVLNIFLLEKDMSFDGR